MTTRKVLIVEDSPEIADLVAMHLRDIDCDPVIVDDGREGVATFQSGHFDLVILDLMLPGMDGLAICREIRKAANYVPILMLTSKSSELDRVLGLEMGADDYLTKPFSIAELVARIKALFRRAEALAAPSPPTSATPSITHDELHIDVEKHQVTVDGKAIGLTAREFDLLLHFARHPGRVFNRIQLLDAVWGYSHEGYEHTVNTHINRLRRKLEQNPAKPHYIQTVWGVGYKLTEGNSP